MCIRDSTTSLQSILLPIIGETQMDIMFFEEMAYSREKCSTGKGYISRSYCKSNMPEIICVAYVDLVPTCAQSAR